MEGYDVAVLCMEVSKDGFEIGERVSDKPEQAADDGYDERSWRERSMEFFGGRFGSEEMGKDGFEDETDGDGDEDEKPGFHG